MKWRLRENQNGSSELFHYGVKGMKWGVRKEVKTSGMDKKQTETPGKRERTQGNPALKAVQMHKDLESALKNKGVNKLPKNVTIDNQSANPNNLTYKYTTKTGAVYYYTSDAENRLVNRIKEELDKEAKEMMNSFNRAMSNAKLKMSSNDSVKVDKSDPDNLRYVYTSGNLKQYFKANELEKLINSIKFNKQNSISKKSQKETLDNRR